MSTATVAIVIAVVSALFSLGAAVFQEVSRSRSSREVELLKHQLATSRMTATKAAEAQRIVAEYRDPLLRSAFDLQSRIYNVLRPGGFQGRREPDYFRNNTLFVIAEFLGWLELIRREVQFLDLGAINETKELASRLYRIRELFASTSRWKDEYYIYRGQQRAIGELMISPVDSASRLGPRHECIGYASFVAKMMDEEAFAKWFRRLGDAIEKLPGHTPARLIEVQHALIGLIDFLDPNGDRIADRRAPLSVS